MIFFYESNGENIEISGGLIKKYIIRTDLVPIPMTIEIDIRNNDEDLINYLIEGNSISNEDGDQFTILKSELVRSANIQGDNLAQYVSIIAVLSEVVEAAYVRNNAITLNQTTLASIYRSIGCRIGKVSGDFNVPVFCCLSGDTPSFQIAAILQESGGVVFWKNGVLNFKPLAELFLQEKVADLPILAAEDISSGFLERQEIPSFYSIDAQGKFIYGNVEKTRSARFVVNKDLITLRNMSTCLVLKQVSRISYNENIVAGDLVPVNADESLVVITSATVFSMGIDGDTPQQYTKLWLGSLST